MAALAGAHVVLEGLHLNEVAALLQILHNLLAGFHAGEAGVLATVLVDGAVLVHHVDDGQVVALAHLEVVGVVGGGDFHHTGAEVHLHVLIGHNGDFLVHQGQDDVLAHQVLVALVLGVDRHGGIAQHGLRAGGGQLDVAAAVGQGVAQVPEGALLLLKDDLRVGDGGLSERADLGLKYINQLENQNVNLTIHSLEKVIVALELTPEEFFNFDSLEVLSDSTDSLSLKRVNMKIKQLPVGKREKILTIFEDLLDSL